MSRYPVTTALPDEVLDATLGAITIGLVPVMGTLHEGHLSLIRRSNLENDDTIVAIFDPAGNVPEVSQADIRLAKDAGARIFYRPEPETILPHGFSTAVTVADLPDRWEGEHRPGHFDRVTTLFAILLNQLQPTRTYVGEKHLQQLEILRRMHEDLSLSGEIVPCPTVRDPDGLPLSSYNRELDAEERAAALAIPDALFAIQQRMVEGETDSATLLRLGNDILAAQPRLVLDYLAIVDPETFVSVPAVVSGSRVIVAGSVGGTRILDNLHLEPGGTGSTNA